MRRVVWAIAVVVLAQLLAQTSLAGCPIPNPNINGPPFIDGCEIPAHALNRLSQPAGPTPGPVCPFGNAVVGYTTFGTRLVCGTSVSGGSIATGSNQIGAYIGANTIGPLTPGGDVSFANPNFSVTGIRGHPVTSTAPVAGQVVQYDGASYAPARITPTADGTIACATVTITNGVPSFAAGTCGGGGGVILVTGGTSLMTGGTALMTE